LIPSINIYSQVVSTENYQKVIKAILTIFPDAKIEKSTDNEKSREINAQLDINCLKSFTDMLEKQQILDSARKRARKGLEESELEKESFQIKLRFNKQSAFAGKINFLDIDDEFSPLHYFELLIRHINDIEEFLNEYFPEWKSRREERKKIENRLKISMKNEEKSKQKLKKSK